MDNIKINEYRNNKICVVVENGNSRFCPVKLYNL